MIHFISNTGRIFSGDNPFGTGDEIIDFWESGTHEAKENLLDKMVLSCVKGQ